MCMLSKELEAAQMLLSGHGLHPAQLAHTASSVALNPNHICSRSNPQRCLVPQAQAELLVQREEAAQRAQLEKQHLEARLLELQQQMESAQAALRSRLLPCKRSWMLLAAKCSSHRRSWRPLKAKHSRQSGS